MPVQSMQCPKCGKWATEYDLNKWQCLSCQTKFIYEPPVVSAQSELHVKHELEVDDLDKQGLIYVCSRCNLRFSRLTKPDQSCVCCGAPICPECFVAEGGRECKLCINKRIMAEKTREEARKARNAKQVGGCLAIFSVAFLVMIVLGAIQGQISEKVAAKEREKEKAALLAQQEMSKKQTAEREARATQALKKQEQEENKYIQEAWLSPTTHIYSIPSTEGPLLRTTEDVFTSVFIGHAKDNWYAVKKSNTTLVGYVVTSSSCPKSIIGELPKAQEVQSSLAVSFTSKPYWGKTKISIEVYPKDNQPCWRVCLDYRMKNAKGDYVQDVAQAFIRKGVMLEKDI